MSDPVSGSHPQSAPHDNGSREADLLRALESQDQFMSFLSHEIRGGLNGIVLLLEVIRRDLIRRGPDLQTTVEDLNQLRQAVYDTVSKMDRALLADRIRRGRVTPDRQPVQLRAVIDDALKAVRKSSDVTNATLSTDVHDGATLETDPLLLARALTHLVENAVRFAGGPVTISATADDHHAHLSVRDQGPGLDPERLPWLLDPNRRPDAKHKGLGLPTALQIVKLLGGSLHAASTPNSATEFRITLPTRA